jgi:hypothetical protein
MTAIATAYKARVRKVRAGKRACGAPPSSSPGRNPQPVCSMGTTRCRQPASYVITSAIVYDYSYIITQGRRTERSSAWLPKP